MFLLGLLEFLWLQKNCNEQRTDLQQVIQQNLRSVVGQESLETRGFVVEMVANGALAIERFTAFEPDIAVLDVVLPDLPDGL